MRVADLQVLARAVAMGGAQATGEYSQVEIKQGLNERFDVEISDDMARLVDSLYNRTGGGDIFDVFGCLVVMQPADINEAIEIISDLDIAPDTARGTEYLPRLVLEAGGPENVYLSHGGIDNRKFNALKSLDRPTRVADLKGETHYDQLTSKYGFSKLSSVHLTNKNLSQMGVPADVRRDLLDDVGFIESIIGSIKYRVGL